MKPISFKSEGALQQALVMHLSRRPAKGVMWFAVPNGLASNPVAVARMKGIGMKPGVADLIFFRDGRAYCLEMKTVGGRQSELQRQFERECADAGIPYKIAWGLDEAIEILAGWGLL